MGLVLPTIDAYQVQHLPIVKASADKIGLVEVINQVVPTEMAIDPGTIVLGMILDTLTDRQMEDFLNWRSDVESDTETPLEGTVFSFLLTRKGFYQILVRPSTDVDLKLKNIARLDGTYDTFARHEEVLQEYDDLGFASIEVLWRDVGLKLYLCDGSLLGIETTPRCYVECLHDPQQPLLSFRVSDDPELLEEDVSLRVFAYTPLPPALYQRIQHFIRTNVTVLLRHWHGEIGSFKLLDVLQPPGGCDDIEGNPQPWYPLPDSTESQGEEQR